MDSVTQQNAALVEQSAAAAESLHTQAGQLTQVVSMFILDQYALPKAPVAIKSTARAMPVKPVLKLAASRGAVAKPALVKKAAKVSAGANGGDWEEF